MPLHHVILDTDIGSDVDDALALIQILGTPSIALAGVTTVYGDATLRARIARRYAALAGIDLLAHPGIATPLSGREVWWAGHEGSLHSDLDSEPVADSAVDYLVRTVLEQPGAIDIVAIGPLTNIAAAIQADPRFAPSVRGLWVMGGSFAAEEPEHNFRSDTAAAQIVFDAGIPTVVTGLEVTRQIEIREDSLAKIAQSGPAGRALQADIAQWWEYWDTQWNVPHDPVTVLTLTRPDLFAFSGPGRVQIRPDGEQAGLSVFQPDPRGWARIAESADATAVGDEIVRAIVAAGDKAPILGPVTA
ncbi:nucleoside hydrolase [Diaminobutyricibacter sp. McL0618]|uniref:nucleoside hydrolase n=1 Tax=Leifsonia sp. McL0618 TaxID=3415677 RepID=UPI003CECB585